MCTHKMDHNFYTDVNMSRFKMVGYFAVQWINYSKR
jgi:hypothetical protein